jgi:hypothetical protein
MQFNNKTRINVILAVIILLAASVLLSAQEEVIELKFGQPPASGSDEAKTLNSMVRVRKISETYATGGLYLMTHFGDREELFKKENQSLIDNPFINQSWRYCSLFAASSEDSVYMGRNWDNQNVGSIIVSLYHPPKGYSSISFSRAIEMGFPLNVGLEGFKSNELGKKLLLAPFYSMEGINEHGLTIAVAGVNDVKVKSKEGKEQVFISFLIRKILDQTKTIEEAMNLAEKHVPFLLDKNSLQAHLMIADSSGSSVILEYVQDEWKKIHPEKNWQVLTNRPVYEIPDATLREKCWRYRSISEAFDETKGKIDWKAGMRILQDVEQKGTTWSVIYSPTAKDLFFTVYQDWDKTYHLSAFQ